MFFWITGEVRWPKFFSIVATASRSHSTAARTSYPARSAPRSRPPAPANSETATPWMLTPTILPARASKTRQRQAGRGRRFWPGSRPWSRLLAFAQFDQLVVGGFQQALQLGLHLRADLELEPAPVVVELRRGREHAAAGAQRLNAGNGADVLPGRRGP